MNEPEARLILQSYRPGAPDATDPFFADALREAGRTPELARWLADEQAFDAAIAAQLESIPAPFGLKTRLLAQAKSPAAKPGLTRWVVALAFLAALLFLVAQVVSPWRPASRVAASVPDYAREMVSFVHLNPPLDLASSDLGTIEHWLTDKEAAAAKIPAPLAALTPAGCRILSFRGHDVTLICFHRDGDRLAHLFVVDRAALPGLKPGAQPVFANAEGWATATWADKDHAYMVTVQGDEAAVRHYLPDA